MSTSFIGGLSLQLMRSHAIYLSHAGGRTAVIEIGLRSTNAQNQQAVIGTVVHGEPSDLKALGIPEAGRAFLIGTDASTEVIPGVLVTVRANGHRPYVTRHSVSLVISADPAIWMIEREVVMDARLRRHSRPLFPGYGENG